MACGLLFGVLIREFCYVPRNFWAGILVATALSNWTSLRTRAKYLCLVLQ